MNLEPVIQSKESKKEQKSYINTYIWSLEKWYWWTYLQRKNGDTVEVNGLLDKQGKEMVGQIGNVTLIYVHYHV